MPDEERPAPAEGIPPAELDRITVPSVPPPGEEEGQKAEQEEGRALDQASEQAGGTLDLEERELDLQIKAQGLEQARHEQEERTKYAGRLFKLIIWWLAGIGGIVVAQGIRQVPCLPNVRFELSEAVLLGLIGGTTINVLGIFIVVVNYLFPKRSGS